MAEIETNESLGNAFCGNCGEVVEPGAAACGRCGEAVLPENDSPEFGGDYIPYCRACGVPVAKDEALHCTKCGVTPLCREHYFPSTRSCALCPPIEAAVGSVESDTPGSAAVSDRPTGPWAQAPTVVPCPNCGARIRQGVDFCPNCGAEQEGVAENARYAGFLVRLVAAIVDSLITGVPAAVLTSFTDITALGTLLSVVYYVLFTYVRGQTPGKMLLGIHVVDENDNKPSLKQVLMREVIGKAIAALALLIGYLWIIWDPKKRGWHDHIAGTYVIRRKGSRITPNFLSR